MSEKSISKTIQTDAQKKLAETNFDRYLYARQRGHTDFIKKHDECDAFVFDEQWTQAELDKLELAKRPALTINKIKPALYGILDDYLRNRIEVKFIPSSGGRPDTAASLTKLYSHISNTEDFPAKEQDLVVDGLISGRGYYIVRIGFDDNFRGEVRLSVPNPKNVIPDPDSDSRYPHEWKEFIHDNLQSLQEVEFNYGKDKARLVKAMGPGVETREQDHKEENSFGGKNTRYIHGTEGDGDPQLQRIYHVIERQYRRIEKTKHFRNRVTGDLRRVPPHWDDDDVQATLEEDENLEVDNIEAEVIRWTVSCNGVLLHDGISPYRSFSVIPYFPFFRRGRTSGAVESLIDPQRNYNKLRSSELHIVSGTSNSGWKVKAGSLKNMDPEQLEQKGSMTGLVLVYEESPEDIERIQPVSIPQGMDRISSKADADIRQISGIPDDPRATQQASGRAIEAARQSSLINTTIFFESLNYTRKLLANKVLELVQAFYTEERQLIIVGEGLSPEVETLGINVPNDEDGTISNDLTAGEYSVVVTSAPARDSQEQEQFEMLARMQQDLGVPIPSHLLVEFSSLDRKEEIAEEIRKVTGTSTPSEEERELQLEEQRLVQQEKKASIAARMAQAKLSEARANKVLAEVERLDSIDEAKLEELLLKAQELDARRVETEGSLEIRRRAQETQELKTLLQSDLDREQLVIKLMEVLDKRKEQRNDQSSESTQGDSDAAGT